MQAESSLRRKLARVIHEPLIQFLFLGGALFFTAHGVAKHRDEVSREIVVDSAVVERLAKMYEMQTGAVPGKERLTGLVDEYVRDEVLFREAVKMGLDQNDEIIRRRLTQKFDFLQRDMQVVAEPSATELERYYQSHLSQFAEPGTVSFSHIYFSPDRGGNDAAKARAERVLAQLRQTSAHGATPSARQLGDPFPLQYDYVNLTQVDAAQLFGKSPIVESLFATKSGAWAGPFNSGYGWHLVYVGNRKDESSPPFDRVKDRVHEAYLEQAREQGNATKFAELKANYIISRADTVAGK